MHRELFEGEKYFVLAKVFSGLRGVCLRGFCGKREII